MDATLPRKQQPEATWVVRVEPAGFPASPLTDPDVKISLIRFLGNRSVDTASTQNFAILKVSQIEWTILGLGSGYVLSRCRNSSQL